MNMAYQRTYSLEEALSYASAKVDYCDQMAAQFPDASLDRLRVRAGRFIDILKTHPRNLVLLGDLKSELERESQQEGTGWQVFLEYVSEYVEHVQQVIS
jgi:metallophosphoesterase superfamily enzyme